MVQAGSARTHFDYRSAGMWSGKPGTAGARLVAFFDEKGHAGYTPVDLDVAQVHCVLCPGRECNTVVSVGGPIVKARTRVLVSG
jgi:hypothetical protein